MLIPNSNKTAYNYIDSKGNEYPDECPYFEGVEIISIMTGTDEYQPLLKIEVNNNGKQFNFLMPIEELYDSKFAQILAKNGLILQSRDVNDAEKILIKASQSLANTTTEIQHPFFGWHKINNKLHFLFNENTINNIKYKCTRNIFFTDGTLADYDNFLSNTVSKSNSLTLAYMLGLSAVLVSKLYNENIIPFSTVIVNLAGRSSTGKSTAAKLALSAIASPNFNRKGLGVAVSATQNGLIDSLNNFHGAPRVLDDINQNTGINIHSLIYELAQGENKIRSGRMYQDNNNGWSGTILITSETPFVEDYNLKLGEQARLLTLSNVAWTKSAEEANDINITVANNYGLKGVPFANYLTTLTIDKLQDDYNNWRAKLKKVITIQDKLTDRIVEKMAVIGMTIDYAIDCFPEFKDCSAMVLMSSLIDSELESTTNRDCASRLIDIVVETIEANYHRFITNYHDYPDYPSLHSKAECEKYGVIDYYGYIPADRNRLYHPDLRNYKEVSIYAKRFNEIVKSKHFNCKAEALQKLRDDGKLRTDKGRNDRKIDGVRCYTFKFDLKNNPVNSEPTYCEEDELDCTNSWQFSSDELAAQAEYFPSEYTPLEPDDINTYKKKSKKLSVKNNISPENYQPKFPIGSRKIITGTYDNKPVYSNVADNNTTENKQPDTIPADGNVADNNAVDNATPDNQPADSNVTDNNTADNTQHDTIPDDGNVADNNAVDNATPDNQPVDSNVTDNSTADNTQLDTIPADGSVADNNSIDDTQPDNTQTDNTSCTPVNNDIPDDKSDEGNNLNDNTSSEGDCNA